MGRKLIIDGNAVYELDEDCMLKKRLGKEQTMEKEEKEQVFETKKRKNK